MKEYREFGMDDPCKGCKSYLPFSRGGGDEICSIYEACSSLIKTHFYAFREACPCTTCLVKSFCNNTDRCLDTNTAHRQYYYKKGKTPRLPINPRCPYFFDLLTTVFLDEPPPKKRDKDDKTLQGM
jgi:hypothetical protein